MSRVRVAIAGSTGSIGTQTLDVVRAEAGPLRGRRARRRLVGRRRSIAQAREFRPQVVAVADASRAAPRSPRRCRGTEVVGDLADLVEPADVVVNAVVGFAGLPVTIGDAARRQAPRPGQQGEPDRRRPGGAAAARDARRRARPGRQRALRRPPVPALARRRRNARSPGSCSPPAAGRSAAARADELADVTVDEALAHPTWSMGPKITIDSSTLMNKGLEVIEAHELFGVAYDQIEVVVHPQSIVHSMVEFTDGSTIAQLSMPDMRLPIGYALAYPARIATPFGRIDWAELGRLDFERARHGDVPLPGPGLRRRAHRWHGAGLAERRQRGRRRGVPRRPARWPQIADVPMQSSTPRRSDRRHTVDDIDRRRRRGRRRADIIERTDAACDWPASQRGAVADERHVRSSSATR